jgi:hypothetical protein
MVALTAAGVHAGVLLALVTASAKAHVVRATPRSAPAVVGGGLQDFWVLLGIIAVVALIAVVLSARGRMAKAVAEDALLQQLTREAETMELKPVSPGDVVVHAGETFYWEQPARLGGWRTHTHYVGGYAGVSVRVMRGVYARTGGGRGQPVTEQTLDLLDAGTLLISDQRLVFAGEHGTIEVKLPKIGAIHPHADGATVDVVNGKAHCFVTGDPRVSIVLGRIINRQLAAAPTGPTA